MGKESNGSCDGPAKRPECKLPGCLLCTAVDMANDTADKMFDAVRRIGLAAANAHNAASSGDTSKFAEAEDMVTLALADFAVTASHFFGDVVVVCGASRSAIRTVRTAQKQRK